MAFNTLIGEGDTPIEQIIPFLNFLDSLKLK